MSPGHPLMKGRKRLKSQHPYFGVKCAEIAHHEVITTVERSLYYRRYTPYTLASFLDTKGPFNNVSTKTPKQNRIGGI